MSKNKTATKDNTNNTNYKEYDDERVRKRVRDREQFVIVATEL